MGSCDCPAGEMIQHPATLAEGDGPCLRSEGVSSDLLARANTLRANPRAPITLTGDSPLQRLQVGQGAAKGQATTVNIAHGFKFRVKGLQNTL